MQTELWDSATVSITMNPERFVKMGICCEPCPDCGANIAKGFTQAHKQTHFRADPIPAHDSRTGTPPPDSVHGRLRGICVREEYGDG